jgi:purine nucleosidase
LPASIRNLRWTSKLELPVPRIPVLLDTDIGTSLDDTICLAYLAASPAFEIVGVSTVTDQSGHRGDYARSILRYYDVDAPVVAGAERSVSGKTMQPKILPGLPSAPDSSGRAPGTTRRPGSFEELYTEALSRYGEDLVVLSIGPVTNLSAAGLGISGSRNSAPRPRLVSMASSLSGEAEWNVFLDPEAAADLLGTPAGPPSAGGPSGGTLLQERTIVPIETTRRLTMTAEEAMGRLPRYLTAPFGDLSDHPRHPGTVVLHDPLAAHILLEPEHCTYRPGVLEITLGTDPETRGRSRFRKAGAFAPGERVPERGGVVAAVGVDRGAALGAILSALA